MGRPRARNKDMPPGMRLVDGRWYWRLTDEAARLVLQRMAPGRAGLPAGPQNADKHAARKWWAGNRLGKRVSASGFNSMWQRAARAAGFTAHQFHFHDLRAKSASDAPNEASALNMLGHTDPRTTRTVYRRKPIEITPLKRVSK